MVERHQSVRTRGGTVLRLVAMLVAVGFAGSGKAEARPCRVVVFDTSDTAEAYSPSLFNRGETNAHYIVDRIYATRFGYGVAALPAIIGVKYQTGLEAFLDPTPDLAIVHRSTFDHKGDGSGDAELALLISKSPASTPFLVFSRKPDTDARLAVSLAEKARAPGRVTALRLNGADPWADPVSIQRLLAQAKALLPTRGC